MLLGQFGRVRVGGFAGRDRREHLGFSVEYRAFFDLENRRVKRSLDDRGGLDLDPLGREDFALKVSGDDDDVSLYLSGDFGFVPDDEDVGCKNFSLKRAVDATGAFELEPPFEVASFLKDHGYFVADRGKVKWIRSAK